MSLPIAEEVSKGLAGFLIWAGSLPDFYFIVVIHVIIAALSNGKLFFYAPILTDHLLYSFYFLRHHNV